MARTISLLVLVAIVLLIGALFYKVMAQFLLPLFLALLLVILFKPLHEWVLRRCNGRQRLAAGLTTTAIMLIVLLPVAWLAYRSAVEGIAVATAIDQEEVIKKASALTETFRDHARKIGWEWPPDRQLLNAAIAHVREYALPVARGGIEFLFEMLLGMFILVIAVYYFFVDGPGMVSTITRIFPLEDKYERQLIEKFGDLSRTVVAATLVSACAQGLLAGVGYLVAGVSPLFLLTALTMLLALVPFIGAASVWVPVCLWLFVIQERPVTAIVLAIYCMAVVSMIDNIVKPLILHGQAHLHPLLALLSVLGGVTALGPIGIFVGPMVVAFFQALAVMLHEELESYSRSEP